MSNVLVTGFSGFSGTGLQSPKPPGGISFSFLELALVLKVGFGPAKLSSVQKTPQVCSVSLQHSSSGARNLPCLNIIISSSAGEE